MTRDEAVQWTRERFARRIECECNVPHPSGKLCQKIGHPGEIVCRMPRPEDSVRGLISYQTVTVEEVADVLAGTRLTPTSRETTLKKALEALPLPWEAEDA